MRQRRGRLRWDNIRWGNTIAACYLTYAFVQSQLGAWQGDYAKGAYYLLTAALLLTVLILKEEMK